MKTEAAKNLEFTGSISVNTYSDGIHMSFREDPKTDDDYPRGLNLPFEIWSKYKSNKIKITIEKVKE